MPASGSLRGPPTCRRCARPKSWRRVPAVPARDEPLPAAPPPSTRCPSCARVRSAGCLLCHERARLARTTDARQCRLVRLPLCQAQLPPPPLMPAWPAERPDLPECEPFLAWCGEEKVESLFPQICAGSEPGVAANRAGCAAGRSAGTGGLPHMHDPSAAHPFTLLRLHCAAAQAHFPVNQHDRCLLLRPHD